MSHAPSIGIPELAGLATYAEAARLGFSVEENVRRLVRYHRVCARLMYASVAHLAATPEWEVKCALALHHWQDAEHADALRRRVSEMRSPPPPMDEPLDAPLEALLEEMLHAHDTVELLTGLYVVARSAVLDAWREHIATTNPLVDQPTIRLLTFAITEEERAIAWARTAIDALTKTDAAAAARAREWESHLRGFLDAAGGIVGTMLQDDVGDSTSTRSTHRASTTPLPRATTPFVPDTTPRRDARFSGQYNFNFPPHVVYNMAGVPPDERNLALLCKRTLEMDVPEMMASFLVERRDLPWDVRLAYARQLWDEARHAMMGTVAFEARAVDWTKIPLNVSFALRLNRHAAARERQAMLWGIEQSLMPGETGKRSEYHTALEAGDALSARFHDYDWADEVLHAQIGRKWLRAEGLSAADALKIGAETHEKTWAALREYASREPQTNWWPQFVERVLGHASAADPEQVEAAIRDIRVVSG